MNLQLALGNVAMFGGPFLGCPNDEFTNVLYELLRYSYVLLMSRRSSLTCLTLEFRNRQKRKASARARAVQLPTRIQDVERTMEAKPLTKRTEPNKTSLLKRSSSNEPFALQACHQVLTSLILTSLRVVRTSCCLLVTRRTVKIKHSSHKRNLPRSSEREGWMKLITL